MALCCADSSRRGRLRRKRPWSATLTTWPSSTAATRSRLVRARLSQPAPPLSPDTRRAPYGPQIDAAPGMAGAVGHVTGAPWCAERCRRREGGLWGVASAPLRSGEERSRRARRVGDGSEAGQEDGAGGGSGEGSTAVVAWCLNQYGGCGKPCFRSILGRRSGAMCVPRACRAACSACP